VSSKPPTSRLLIAEPPLLVLPSLAIAIGLNEAIFLQQLHYWLLRSEHHRDGCAWVYNTYEEWHQQLPFWSLATLRRIVGALEKQGLVVSTTQYNRHKVDRTKWYSLDYPAIDRLLDTADHLLNLSSPSDQTEQMQALNMISSEPESTQRLQTESFEDSKGPVSFEQYDQARLAILPYAEDLARELGDQAPLTSTTTRLTNLYRGSRLELDTFLDLLIAARGITQERTGSIRTPRPDGPGPKPKMAYWFTVLEDLISQTQAATGTGDR